MWKKVLIYFLIILLFLILIYIILKYRCSFVQTNTQNQLIEKIPANSCWRNYCPGSYLSNNFWIFDQGMNNSIVVFYPGMYKVNFCLSAHIDIVTYFKKLINTGQQANIDLINGFNRVDYTIEWRIILKEQCESIFGDISFPAFSNNRTDGPENANSLSKFICIRRPTTIQVQYRNPEELDAFDYRINFLNLTVEKIFF